MSEEKNPVGRPTIMTPENIDKLEQGFLMGFNDIEACLFAGIGKTALYSYQEKHPEFTERKEALKKNITMMSKKVNYDCLKDNDKDVAKWILERRDDEYVKKTESKNETNLKVEGLTLEKALEMDVEELDKIINEG